jgi:uncharacterized protein YihD (DUF1040 family)
MRDSRRIGKTLGALEHYWRRHPDLRLGQIVGNLSRGLDPYFIEDETLLGRLERELNEPVISPPETSEEGT